MCTPVIMGTGATEVELIAGNIVLHVTVTPGLM